MAAAMAMMMAAVKVMASLSTGMSGSWEAAVCGHCLLAVGRSCNKEDDGEMAKMTNRATKAPQGRDNQPACKGRRHQPMTIGRQEVEATRGPAGDVR
jgi:hypothetical protein